MFTFSVIYKYNRKHRRWEIFLRKELDGIYDDMMLTEFYGNKAEAFNAAKNWAKYCEGIYNIEISNVLKG